MERGVITCIQSKTIDAARRVTAGRSRAEQACFDRRGTMKRATAVQRNKLSSCEFMLLSSVNKNYQTPENSLYDFYL
jgi:hypothetical protein